MHRPLRVLIVDDDPDDAERMMQELGCRGFEPSWRRVETASKMRQALAVSAWDVVLSEVALPHLGAAAALAIRNEAAPQVPFVVLSHAITEEVAVELLRSGACDYILKERLYRLARPSSASSGRPRTGGRGSRPSRRRAAWRRWSSAAATPSSR
jgi:DNA-binding NtrC family response regulator